MNREDRYARRRLADQLVRQGRIDEAIEEMRPLADDEHPGAVRRLARLLAGRGRIEEALSVAGPTADRRVVAGWLGSQGRHDLLLARAVAGDDAARHELSWAVQRLWRVTRLAEAVELFTSVDLRDEYLVAGLVRTAGQWRYGRLRVTEAAIDLLGTLDHALCRRVRAGLLLVRGRRDEAVAELRALAAGGDADAARELAEELRREQPAREFRTLDHVGGGRVSGLAFSQDGTLLATRDGDGALVWHARTGEHLHTLASDVPVRAVAFAADGTVVVGEAAWRLATGEHVFDLDPGETRDVAVSPDRRLLATASTNDDGKWRPAVRLWDLATGAHVRDVVTTTEPFAFERLAFSPDGRLLAVACFTWVWLFDPATGEPVRRLGDAGAEAIAYSPGGDLLATGRGRHRGSRDVHLWDPATGAHVRRIETPANALAFSPDGALLATADQGDGVVRFWAV